MRMMVMIIYLLFLICMIVYYGKMMYRNYQKELPLGYGQNKIVYFMILVFIIGTGVVVVALFLVCFIKK